MPIGELLKPSKQKILLDLVFAAILVSLTFIFSPPIHKAFVVKPLGMQVIDIVFNILLYGLVLYPLACIALARKKRQ